MWTGEQGSAVALKDTSLNNINRIIAFDSEGKLLYDDIVRDSVKEISVFGKHIFVRSDTGIIRLNTLNGEEEKYTCQSGNMLIYDESTAMICGESKAVYIKFGQE